MKNNSEIRAIARQSLGGNLFGSRWLLAIAACFLSSLVLSIATSFIIGILLIGPITVGLSYYFLSLGRSSEGDGDLGNLLYATRDQNLGRTIVTGLLHSIFLALWAFIPIVGFVKAYSYRLTYFVAIDHPELDANACITESRRLMNGHKMQAFLLDLSFIGWMILGSCACGIGTLFVLPYMEAANAAFYEEVKAADRGTATL